MCICTFLLLSCKKKKKKERQEGIGTFALKCIAPQALSGLFKSMNSNHIPSGQCPYGDGYAAEKAFEVIESEVQK